MRKTILILSVTFVCSCRMMHESPLFEELDSVLESKATYDGYFSERLAVLRSVLADQKDPEQIYNIN